MRKLLKCLLVLPQITQTTLGFSFRNDNLKRPSYTSSLNHETAKLRVSNNNINEDAANSLLNSPSSRRHILQKAVTTPLITLLPLIQSPQRSTATPEEEAAAPIEQQQQQQQQQLIDVYFGCGCFWHVQHEFVEAERTILGRTDAQITARAGYAGGKAGAFDGKVCYHNALNVADYGKLGHAEVVSLRIPPSKFYDFAVEYFKLFDKDGYRPDQFGDRGGEYRNLVGVPGGSKSEYAKQLVAASVKTGDKLDFAIGKGDDGDLPKVSFVMDTSKYPFYVAEQYHQFHDGFNFGENYPGKYNGLAGVFAKEGESFGSCPNGMLGVGVGGL